jgi:hypothetical protein
MAAARPKRSGAKRPTAKPAPKRPNGKHKK